LNIVDLIIIGFFIIGMLSGYRKGFLGSLVGIFSSIIGLVAAYKYYSLLTGWADRQYQATEKLNQFLREHLVLPQPVSQIEITLPATGLGEYLDKLSLPATLKTQLSAYLQKLAETVSEQASALLGDILHQFIAAVVINGLAFIIIWFVVDRIIMLSALLFSRFIKDSFLGGFDRLGGLFLGFILTALTLTIVVGLATPLLNLADMAEPSLLSAVIKNIGEARLVPCFASLFSFLSTKVIQLLPL